MKTYGTVRYLKAQGLWEVKCEPHVSLKLKRVFPQLSKGSMGSHLFSDTAEFCRDLEWFMDRYPLKASALETSYLHNQGVRHKERVALVEQLLAGKLKPRRFKLAKPPRDYQSISAEMTLATGSLLNADDVGLGKTVSAITVLTDPRTRPALVVTLTHLPKQWAGELHDFAPGLKVHILKSATPYDLTRAENGHRLRSKKPAPMPDVIITNYHKLAGWAETLAPIIKCVIYDEAQELRTGSVSAKYNAANHISHAASFRKGLTATPIYNYGSEIWNVMDCIKPGCLGTRAEFLTEWCDGEDQRGRARIKDPRALGAFLRDNGLMLRRTRADVRRELPGKEPIKIPHYIDANMTALHTISKSCAELARLILKQGESRRGEKMQASEEFDSVLRQATGIAKAPFVADFVKILLEQDEKVLLYGWHHAVYDIWQDKLKDYEPAMFTGRETPAKKEESKQRFLTGKTPLIIMSNRAGAGIDGLQKTCRTAVVGELDWSSGEPGHGLPSVQPEEEKQDAGRSEDANTRNSERTTIRSRSRNAKALRRDQTTVGKVARTLRVR